LEASRKENHSLLRIINNQILHLNTILFIVLFSVILGFAIFYFSEIYNDYIDEKLDFVEYQFSNIIKDVFRDIENFIENGTVPFNALLILEIDSYGNVRTISPYIETYKNFYFGNDELFEKTLRFGEYVSGFTKKFLTEDPIIVVSKKHDNRVFLGLFSVENISRGSEVLQGGQKLFFVDKYGFGVKVSQQGHDFVDFLEIESREKKVPLLNLNYSNLGGKMHIFFHRDLPYGFKCIVAMPFINIIKPYIYFLLIFAFLVTLNITLIPRFLLKKIKIQLEPIRLLSEHMLKSSGTTPINLGDSLEMAEEIKNLVDSFNRMVKEAHENQRKLSSAVKKLSRLNENMRAVNSILFLSDEMFKRLILKSNDSLAILREYIMNISKAVPSFKYFGYNGELGTLEIGERVGRSLVMRLSNEEVRVAFEDDENDEMKFFENTVAQEILNFIRDLKLAVQIQNLIRYDPLTKLFNRKYFEELFERELLVANRYKRILSFVMIDMDNFKAFNDEFGHQFGDKILQKFGEALLKSFRQSDVVGRYGGDEFQILMLETPKNKALDKIEKIKKEISIFDIDGVIVKIDFSFGIAEFPKDGKTKNELLKVADLELYKVKNLKKQLEESQDSKGTF